MQQTNNDQTGNWKFHNEDEASAVNEQTAATPTETQKPQEPVSWTASEFIAHHKDAGWYFLLLIGLVSLCGLIYFIIGDIISVVAIAVVAFLYLIISNAKPRQRSYSINSQGISIDDKFYPFNSFKSFAITQEGAIGCINFLPLKRLLPEISIYFAPDDGPRIIDVLSGSLPNDQRQERGVDRLMKRLHF